MSRASIRHSRRHQDARHGILAGEDVGLADPHALSVAMAAQQAAHFVGMPEAVLPQLAYGEAVKVACEVCNGGASEAEEQFKVFVSIKDGPHSPALQDFWRNGGLRTVRNNQRLMRQLRSRPRLWLRSRETVAQPLRQV